MNADIDGVEVGRFMRRYTDRWCYFGGGSQKTESTNTVDPALLAKYNQNYDRASQVADNFQFTPYSGERVASFNPTQLAGQAGLLSAANDPTATNTLNNAASGIGGLLSYRPPSIAAPATVNAGQLSNTDLSPYMNPFTKNVIDQTIGQQQYARDQQGVRDNASATAAHAFGGSRQGVQRALTTEGYDRNTGGLIAGLNSDNFAQAQAAATGDINRRLGADQYNATGGYNAGVANAGNDIAGAGLRLNAGNSLANISDQQLRDAITRMGIVSGVGDQQQGQQQAQDDAAYEEFIRQITAPIQSQDIRNAALGMIPLQQTQTQTTTRKGDVLGGILGAIAGGAKIGSQFYGGK